MSEFRDLKKVESLKNHPEVIEEDGYYWDPTPLPGKDYSDSEVPTGSKKVGNFIRSKMDGLQTREAMARLGEMVGINTHKAVKVAEENKIRQNALEQYTNRMIVEMTGKDVFAGPEVIGARGGKFTLGERLDETDAKLDQIIINVLSPPSPLSALDPNGVVSAHGFLNHVFTNYQDVELYFPDGTYFIDIAQARNLGNNFSKTFKLTGTGKNSIIKINSYLGTGLTWYGNFINQDLVFDGI